MTKLSFQQELDYLLEEVCVNLGFCDRDKTIIEKIYNSEKYSIEEFVNDIFTNGKYGARI